MKVAPVIRALRRDPGTQQVLVHTGQHYDFNMSDVFFQQLEMAAPDVNLKVGSGTHAQQTADIMVRFEAVASAEEPDLVLVYGDVNSTVATALVCAKLGIKVGHVEAGLRSFDRNMPEEVNRVLTDQIADLLFTPSTDGDANLRREGIAPEKTFFVGNVMIDTLTRMLPKASEYKFPELPSQYALVTLHRAANVDEVNWLKGMLETLTTVSRELAVIFPVHPRTRQRMSNLSFRDNGSVRLLEPLPYIEFLALQQHAKLVITDSGGIQEETTFLGIPCLTVRDNTERPVTVEIGTNEIVGRDLSRIALAIERVLDGNRKASTVPPLWDGHAGERIADVILGNGNVPILKSDARDSECATFSTRPTCV